MLLNVAITQYEQLEQTVDVLQEQEILHNLSKKHVKDTSKDQANSIQLGFSYGNLSVIDAH